MPEYYVSLVKEYLEMQGFIVKTETKYKKEKNWGDIDILAIKIKNGKIVEFIVGEVKGEYKTPKEVRKINEEKFENPFVKQKLKELFGSTKYKKYLYCWSWTSKSIETAKELGITPVSFTEIINYMLEKVKEHKGWFYINDYPNLMLLQFLQSQKYIKQALQPNSSSGSVQFQS